MGRWQDLAACATGIDPEIFHSEDPADIMAAKRLCATCPVAAECLALGQEIAAETEDGLVDEIGIWGGLTGREIAPERMKVPQKLRRDRGLSLLAQGMSVRQVMKAVGASYDAVTTWERESKPARVA